MKKLITIALVSLSFLMAARTVHAQDSQDTPGYKSALGLKFGGYEDGFSAKYFASPAISYEGVLGIRNHGVVITGLYEINQQVIIPGMNFYYGFGGHLGVIGKGDYDRFGSDNEYYATSHLLLGADGVIGLEYKVPQAPIAVSLDLNPRIELASGPFFDIAPGLGVKYTF